MANFKRLAPYGFAADATDGSTPVECTETPFAPGFNAVAVINTKGVTGTPVFKVQGSNDEAVDGDTVWTDLMVTSGILTDQFVGEVVCYRWMRVVPSTAASAGDLDAYLLSGAGG